MAAENLPQPQTTSAIAKPRKRRRASLFIWFLLFLMAAFLLVTQSPLTSRFVLPRLSALVGARVTAESVRIRIDGVVILRRPKFTLEAPGLSGPAATLAEATRAEGKLAFWSMVGGKVVLDKLTLEEPVVRVSQNLTDGTLNLGALHFDRGQTVGPDGKPAPNPIGEVPLIVVDRGAIELGEHTQDGYTLLKRLSLNGTIEPALGPEGGFRIKLAQSDVGTVDVGSKLTVQGRVTSSGLVVSLQGFDLSDWPSTVMPADLRGQFRSLELEGQIKQADLNYDFIGIPAASMELADVALSLPVAAETGPDGTPPKRLRLTQTSGKLEFDPKGLRANIRGKVEDVPYAASLIFEGTDPQGPFQLELSSEGYTIGKNPAFKQFMNETVKDRIRDFGEPTGHIVTIAHIRRGPMVNGQSGPVVTTGTVKLTKGTAAFHKFPYQWSNIDAEIDFTDEEIKIKRLTGTNPQTGATISAHGIIGPLTDDAGVMLDITADHMPMDEVLYQALKPGERDGLKAIFSDDDIKRLETEELIATPANRAALQAKRSEAEKSGNATEVRRLTEILDHRAFVPRGVASITVSLRRPIGPDKDWDQDIRVKAPGAGMVSEAFPLPMKAGEFELRIGNDNVEITGKDMKALSGGAADLSVKMTLAELRAGGSIVPHVNVDAKALVVDDLVRRALNTTVKKFAGSSRDRIAQIVSDMHPSGAVSGRVDVIPDKNRAGGANVNLALANLEGTPHARGSTPNFMMKKVAFALETRGDLFQINTSGDLISSSGALPFIIRTASAVWSDPQIQDRSALDIGVRVEGLSLDADAASILAVFSQTAATRVASSQQSLVPTGTGDIAAQLRMAGDGELELATIDFEKLKSPALTLLNTRLTCKDPSGQLRVQIGRNIKGANVTLQNFATLLMDEDSIAAKTISSGTISVGDGPTGQVEPQSGEMRITLSEGRYESATLRSVTVASAPSMDSVLKEWDPRGVFDMTMVWSPANKNSIEAIMSPRAIDVQRLNKRVALTDMSGEFVFNNTGGTFHELSGNGSSWSSKVNGNVKFPNPATTGPAKGAATFDTTIALQSKGLPQDLAAALPQTVNKVLAQLAVEIPVDGPLQMRNTHIVYTIGPTLEAVDAQGQVTFGQAKLNAGVDVTEAEGDLVFKTQKVDENPATFELDAAINRAKVADLQLSNGRVRAINGSNDGDVHIPTITANCHGGLLSASADLLVKSPNSNEKNYDLQVRLSGANFAPLVDDFRKGPDHATDNDGSRGVIDASLSLAGTVDQPKTRRGRIFATIGGGEVAKFPTLVAMLRLSNFQPPLSEPLDLAEASGIIDGERINFEELLISSESVAMVGYGTMAWPSTELDLRFNSRSNWRIPVISWALEKFRNELITTRVRGTIRDPKIETVSLPGTASILKELSGRATEQDRRLKRMRDSK